MKGLKTIVLCFVFLIAATVFASAVNIQINYVKINDEIVSQANGRSINLQVQRGDSLNVKVCLQALANVQDAQVEADIYGYRYSLRDPQKVSDSSPTFDLDQNDTVCKTLNLQVPTKMDMDYYKVHVMVADRDSTLFEQSYELHVKGIDSSSAVQIKDFTIDPTQVVAGRPVTAMIQVKNYGHYDLSGLKLTMSIPQLNLQQSAYMNSLNADQSKVFEELYLRIPDCAKPGTYTVTLTVDFDEYEETTKDTTIQVVGSDTCGIGANNGQTPPAQKTVVTVPNYQEISQGQSVVYPVMITNPMAVAKTYTIAVSGTGNWATTRIDPSAVTVVPAGQSKTVYLYVSANNNAEVGEKAFTLSIDSSDGDTRQVAITAKVTGNNNSSDSWSGLKNGLEIGLVILVIILIIIGLIIGFGKLKENKNEPTETYY